MSIVSERQGAFNAPTENGTADADKYDCGFPLFLAEKMVGEVAERLEGLRVDLPDVSQAALCRTTLDALKGHVQIVDEAFPSVEEIVALVYWEAMEHLGKFNLDFTVLFDYHCKGDGDAEEVSA